MVWALIALIDGSLKKRYTLETPQSLADVILKLYETFIFPVLSQ